MADFYFSLRIEDVDAEEVAGELERIAKMVREGFTSGDTMSTGWWDFKDLSDSEEESDIEP